MKQKFTSTLNKTLMDFYPNFYRAIDPIINNASFSGNRLNENQIKTLVALHNNGVLTPGEISNYFNIKKGSLTVIIKSLTDIKLILKKKDSYDDRSYYIFLTESGKNFIKGYFEQCDSYFTDIFNNLLKKDKKSVQNGLKILNDYIQKISQSPKRSYEFDRFGPWIYEINEEDKLPSLFIHYVTREERPEMSIKIPREIERRNANPSMNLYDFVINLYQDDMQILERVGDKANNHYISYNDIESIHHREDILMGELKIFTAKNKYFIPFNAVSKDIIIRLVNRIRNKFTKDKQNGALAKTEITSKIQLSFLFTNILKEIVEKEPEFRLLAVQSDIPYSTIINNTFQKLFYKITGRKILESLHFTDGKELMIIRRTPDNVQHGRAVYGAETFLFRINKIKDINWIKNDKREPIIKQIISISDEQFPFTFHSDNTTIQNYTNYFNSVLKK